MADEVTFTVDPSEAGQRLDVTVASRVPALSRAMVQGLVRSGSIRVAGRTTRTSHRVVPGETVTVVVDLPPSLSAEPEDIPLQIVYKDRDVAVIDKPPGLVVHPAAGHPHGTLANGLLAAFPATGEVGEHDRPGIVHRLDKDTSGLLMVALTPLGQRSLQSQIAARTAERRYLALVGGEPQPTEATIEAPIGRDPRDRKRMAVYGAAARPARTSYRVLERFPGFSLIEAKLDTGRTHQIRVHMAASGHAVAGDATYSGQPLPKLHRQFLHAYRLSFTSPELERTVTLSSPLPSDLRCVLDRLREGT